MCIWKCTNVYCTVCQIMADDKKMGKKRKERKVAGRRMPLALRPKERLPIRSLLYSYSVRVLCHVLYIYI